MFKYTYNSLYYLHKLKTRKDVPEDSIWIILTINIVTKIKIKLHKISETLKLINS